MSDNILRGQDGHIGVERTSGGGTLSVDRQADGGFANPNPLIAETERIRTKLPQRIRGAAEPSGLPCSCSMFTSKRGAPAEATCVTCGGYRA